MKWLSMRVNASTGAPRLATPKKGNDCEYLLSLKAAIARSSAEVTAPWPPRPCIRICFRVLPGEVEVIGILLG